MVSETHRAGQEVPVTLQEPASQPSFFSLWETLLPAPEGPCPDTWTKLTLQCCYNLFCDRFVLSKEGAGDTPGTLASNLANSPRLGSLRLTWGWALGAPPMGAAIDDMVNTACPPSGQPPVTLWTSCLQVRSPGLTQRCSLCLGHAREF